MHIQCLQSLKSLKLVECVAMRSFDWACGLVLQFEIALEEVMCASTFTLTYDACYVFAIISSVPFVLCTLPIVS
jgi:hypothetical protein